MFLVFFTARLGKHEIILQTEQLSTHFGFKDVQGGQASKVDHSRTTLDLYLFSSLMDRSERHLEIKSIVKTSVSPLGNVFL